jgi:iron complex transport system ATP-binding protein
MAIQISHEMIIMSNENVVQDQPCNFISNGNFETLFKDENIAFDSQKGKFIVQ